MKLLLDTTYLLPAIGISVKNFPKDAPIKLIKRGHKIHISDISIFELSAKGAKHIASGSISPERVNRGIRAIIHDESIAMISSYETTVLLTAFKIRSVLDDFVDCLILSSAINLGDALITEDSDIRKLGKNSEFNELLSTVNPEFKIQTLDETL